MSKWLHMAIEDGIANLEAHADEVGLNNIEEFTFRAFLMGAIVKHRPNARLQTEWHKYDLLAQVDGENHLIELKCYVLRRTVGLDGQLGNWKGSAGLKNEGEFWKNIDKLHECKHAPIRCRHLVMCYQRESHKDSRYSFEQSYGNIQSGELIEQVEDFVGNRLRCRWFVVR